MRLILPLLLLSLLSACASLALRCDARLTPINDSRQASQAHAKHESRSP